MHSNSKVFFISVVFLIPSYLIGQTYDYSWKENKKELIISSLFWASSQYYDMTTPNDGIEDLSELDVQNLWRLDRKAVNQRSTKASDLSDYALYASIALPFLTSRKSEGQGLSIALMGLQGFFIENGINKYTKTITERPRPYIYREGALLINSQLPNNAERSFYSGHASGSAYFCFFAARTFSDLHPDSKWKPIVWGAAIALPAVTSYLRYKGGNHFPTDVIVGYAAGALVGNFLPKLYRNKKVKINAGLNGLLLSAKF